MKNKNTAQLLATLFGDFSVYNMRGTDKVIMRRKGGPTKEQMRNDPGFANTRRVQSEFGGCSRLAKWMRKMLFPQKALADYNFGNTLTSVLSKIQKEDTESLYGQRNVLLSHHAWTMQNISLNKERATFDAVVGSACTATLSREAASASVSIPALTPAVNFRPAQENVVYRFLVVVGIVPDMFIPRRDMRRRMRLMTRCRLPWPAVIGILRRMVHRQLLWRCSVLRYHQMNIIPSWFLSVFSMATCWHRVG